MKVDALDLRHALSPTLAGREPRHVGVDVGHAHHQSDQHADDANHADDEGARQPEQLHSHQHHSEHEDTHPLNAGQSGDVAAEEVYHQRRNADRPKHAKPGCLKLDVEPNDPDQQQQRADGIDPRAEFLRAERLDIDPLRPGVAQLGNECVDALDRAGGEQRRLCLAVLCFGLEVGQRENVAFGTEHLAVALKLFGLVDHCFDHVFGVAVLLGLRADLGTDGRVDFHLHRRGHLGHASGRPHHDRRGGSDDTLRRHVDFLRGHGDERPGRVGILVDIGDRLAPKLADDVKNILGDVHPATVGLHVEDEAVGLGLHRLFHPPADDVEDRRHNVVAHRHDVDLCLPVATGLFITESLHLLHGLDGGFFGRRCFLLRLARRGQGDGKGQGNKRFRPGFHARKISSPNRRRQARQARR